MERNAPILFKFQKSGDTVTGRIHAIEKVEIADKRTGELKPAIQYVIFDEEKNQAFQILGTYDINCKLRRQDLGKKVVIRFDHVSEEIKKEGQGMFVFRIGVDERSAEQPRKLDDGTQITDADIPF